MNAFTAIFFALSLAFVSQSVPKSEPPPAAIIADTLRTAEPIGPPVPQIACEDSLRSD